MKFRIGIPVVSSCLLGFVICDKTGSKEQNSGVYEGFSHLILVFVLGDRNVATIFWHTPIYVGSLELAFLLFRHFSSDLSFLPG